MVLKVKRLICVGCFYLICKKTSLLPWPVFVGVMAVKVPEWDGCVKASSRLFHLAKYIGLVSTQFRQHFKKGLEGILREIQKALEEQFIQKKVVYTDRFRHIFLSGLVSTVRQIQTDFQKRLSQYCKIDLESILKRGLEGNGIVLLQYNRPTF